MKRWVACLKPRRTVVLSLLLLVLFVSPVVVYATGFNQNISNALNEAFSFVYPGTKISNTLNNSFSSTNNGPRQDLVGSVGECFNDTSGGTCIVSSETTLTNAYPAGTCDSGASQWEYTNGSTLTKVAGSTSGTAVNIPTGDYTFPIVGSGSSTNQCSASPLTYGLSAYWPLSEQTSGACTGSVYDLSGNNNTGTCVNSPTYVSGPFAGSSALNDSSSTARVSSTVFINSTSLSASAWVKLSHASGFSACPQDIYGEGQYSFALGVYPAGTGSCTSGSSEPNLQPIMAVNPSSPTLVELLPTLFPVTVGDWEYVTITWTEGGNFCGYINQTQEACHSTSGALAEQGTPCHFVNLFCQMNSATGIDVSNLMFWQGVALTPSKISELYHTTMPNLEHQVTTTGQTFTTNFYNQYLTNATYTQTNSNPTSSTFAYDNLGQAQTLALTTSYQSIWADASPYTFSDSYVSSSERYSANANGTISSAANLDAVYYHQYSLAYSYSVSGGGTPTAPTVAYTKYGGAKTLLLTSATQSTWGDAGDAVGWTNPLSPSTSSERWATPDANISSLAAAQSSVLTYYHQYPLYLNTSQIKATATVYGTAGTSLSNGTWVDKGSNIYTTGIASFTFPSLSERGYLYQEPSKGFQVLSNVSISSLTFSSSNNQLQWIASAVSTSQTGIIQGYTISQASSNYSLSQSIATMNQTQTTNYFIFTTGGGGGGGGGTGGGGGGYVSPTSTTTVTQSQSQSQTQTQTQVQTGNQTLYYVGAGGIIFILILVFAPLSLRRKDKGIRHENHKPPKGIRHENKKPNKGIRDKH